MSTAVQTSALNFPLSITLWFAQSMVAIVFIAVGCLELGMPIPELAKIMPWAGEHPAWFTRSLGFVDIVGGVFIVLPSVMRILPRLIVLAAFGCAAKQLVAIGYHFSRGETMILVLNIVLLSLALLVFWGRTSKAPIPPRP